MSLVPSLTEPDARLVPGLTEPDARLGFTLRLAAPYAVRGRVTARSPVAMAKQAARHAAPNQSAPLST